MDIPHAKENYETPQLTRLGSVTDVTQGVHGVPQADVLFVGSL